MWVQHLRRMRISSRLIISIISVMTFALLPVPSAVANIPPSFVFTGSGYGHGVGMSQIGARGMALESATAVGILNHFYPGTEVAPVIDTQIIRINIGHRQQDATISIRPLNAKQLEKPSLTLFNDRLAYGQIATESATVGTYFDDINLGLISRSNTIEVTRSSKLAKYAALDPARQWTIRWDTATVVSVRTKERTYLIRYGQINIARVKNDLTAGQMEITASMRLGVEYLYGLGEVPSSWPAASLQAQAIAARTFALTKMRTIRTACDCNIYSTTRDQNFVGYSKESEPTYGVRWKRAVDRTLGLAILFEQRPIQAFYFSSSGGMTQNVKDVWGSEFPYLVNRPDTWSVSVALNPRYAAWTRSISQEVMAKAFELDDVIRYQITSRSITGSILGIRAFSALGAEKILTGEVFRSRTGLPSTWINLPPREEEEIEEVPLPVGNPICLEVFGALFGAVGACESVPE
jgi:stage II sporulation protein D